MSHEPSKLERQLQQATAPADSPDVPLDAEVASMREAWLAFGQLLETVHPAPEEPLLLRTPAKQASRGPWWVAGSIALVASLLVMATAAFSLFGPNGTSPAGGVVQQEPSQPNVPEEQAIAVVNDEPAASDVPPETNDPSPAPIPDPHAIAENEDTPNHATVDDFGWDDPLDDEIALAGQVMVSIQQDWYDVDQAYGSVYQGLRQVEEDMESGML